MTKHTFCSSLQNWSKIKFTCCSTATIVLCASIAITFQSSMLNLNPINFSSNGFFSLFVSSAFVNARLSKSHNKAYKFVTLLMFNGKISYGHRPYCFKPLTFKVGLMSIVNLLSNHIDPFPLALKFDSSNFHSWASPPLSFEPFSYDVNVVAFAQLTSWPFSRTMYPFINHNMKSLLVGVGTP